MRELTVTGREGCPLTGYIAGSTGPALVLANGLGGPISAFRHQVRHFEDRYRVLSWDYRGLYRSRGAVPPVRVDVGAQAEDLEDLLDAAGMSSAIVVGWSMGVQVALELALRAPARVSELVLINGAHGRPMANLRVPHASSFLPFLVERVRAHHRLGARLVARAARFRFGADLARHLRLVSPRLGSDEILALAHEFQALDFDVYLRTLAALEHHDPSSALGRVTARTLVIAGGRDPLFSSDVGRRLSARLRRAELYVVPKATHYAPLEFPELVNARIDAFLESSARDGARPGGAAGVSAHAD
jgi:pimeloyl-ACP methyl ester carboxylesterase